MRKEKNKTHNTKYNRGITLIALIITIVVLLILAIVSIGAINDSNIITHSQTASSKYTIAQEKDTLQLALSEWQLQKNIKDNPKTFKQTIEDALVGEATVGENDPDAGPLTVTFDKTENKYKVYDDGTITTNNEEDNKQEEKTPISTTETYIGYYADVDGNGTVDGIIYADLAVDGSGEWIDSDGAYSYSKKTTLNNYYVSQDSYQYNEFKANPVLAPIDLEKDTLEKNDRFYVMALKDFKTEDYTSFYWYYNAYGNMSDYADTTSTDFGTGKQNTEIMMKKVYGEGLKDQDMWKYIDSEVENGWFIPSRGEWGAFGSFATGQGVTLTNSKDFGLIGPYWSSSLGKQTETYEKNKAWEYCVRDGWMGIEEVYLERSVRLSRTF